MGLSVKHNDHLFRADSKITMGQASRPRPKRLAKKLRAIRDQLGLSQNELIALLECNNELTQARVSAYERGTREPPAIVLLKYARKCLGNGAYLENLIDDTLELPRGTSSGSGKVHLKQKR
jgi:transcriptional regulator with XRE-family HTH domain